MRVPMPEGAQVQSRELYSTTAPMQRQADTQVAQGLGNLAQGIQQAGRGAGDVLAAADAVQKKADAVREAEALTQFQRATTAELVGDSEAGTQGFFSSTGVSASEKSAGSLEALEKARQKIAEGLNERQKQGFMLRSAAALEDSRRQVEGHVAKQFQVAQVATASALQEETLRAIAAGAVDDMGALKQEMQVDELVRKLAPSAEAGAAAASEFHSKAATVRIARSLADGDIDKAEEQFNSMKESLGVRAAEIQGHIARAKKGRDRDRAEAANERSVKALAQAATVDGYLDESKFLDQLKEIPEERRDDMRTLMEKTLRVDEQRKKADIGRWENQALAARLDGKPVPGSTYELLKKHDADFLVKLQREDRAEFRRWKADKDGDAAARRAQAQLDQIAIANFRALPAEEKAAVDIAAWAVGREMSPMARAELGVHQRTAKDAVAKNEAGAENTFMDEVEKAGRDALLIKKGSQKGQPTPLAGPDALATLRAAASQAREEFIAKNKREPNQEERRTIASDLLRVKVVEEHWYGDKKAYEFRDRQKKAAPAPAQEAAPALVEVVSVKTGKAVKVSKATADAMVAAGKARLP